MSAVSTPRITVTGTLCNGCEDTNRDESRHQPGVRRTSANHIEEMVEIEGRDDIDVDASVPRSKNSDSPRHETERDTGRSTVTVPADAGPTRSDRRRRRRAQSPSAWVLLHDPVDCYRVPR
jgi:cation transport ATPase